MFYLAQQSHLQLSWQLSEKMSWN